MLYMTNQSVTKMAFLVLALVVLTVGSGYAVVQTFAQGNESLGMNQTGNQTGNQSFSPVPGLGTPVPGP